MNDFFGMANAGGPASGVQNNGMLNRLSRVAARKDRPSGNFADAVNRAAQKQAEPVRKKEKQSTPHETMAALGGSAMAAQTPVVKEDRKPGADSPDMEVVTEASAAVLTAEETVVFWENLIKNKYGGNPIDIWENEHIVLPPDLEQMPVSELLEILKPQIQSAVLREEFALAQEGVPTDQEWALLDEAAQQGEEEAVQEQSLSAAATGNQNERLDVQAAFQRLVRLRAGQESAAQLPDGEMAALAEEMPGGFAAAVDGEETAANLQSDQSEDAGLPGDTVRKEIPSVQDGRMLAFARPLAAAAQTSVVPAEVRISHVSPSQMIPQIVQYASLRQQAQGTTQLQLVLNPVHLGRVNILLTATADGISAQIRADNDGVRGILSSNVQSLQTQLREMGISMKEIDISGSDMSRNLPQNTGQNNSQSRQQEQSPYRSGADGIAISRFLHKPEPNSYAPPASLPANEEGGVDYRA